MYLYQQKCWCTFDNDDNTNDNHNLYVRRVNKKIPYLTLMYLYQQKCWYSPRTDKHGEGSQLLLLQELTLHPASPAKQQDIILLIYNRHLHTTIIIIYYCYSIKLVAVIIITILSQSVTLSFSPPQAPATLLLSSLSVLTIHYCQLLLCSQLDLWGSPFWVRFLLIWLFFNPTMEVVTFRLRRYTIVNNINTICP